MEQIFSMYALSMAIVLLIVYSAKALLVNEEYEVRGIGFILSRSWILVVAFTSALLAYKSVLWIIERYSLEHVNFLAFAGLTIAWNFAECMAILGCHYLGKSIKVYNEGIRKAHR